LIYNIFIAMRKNKAGGFATFPAAVPSLKTARRDIHRKGANEDKSRVLHKFCG
jgi:hypothetical protein